MAPRSSATPRMARKGAAVVTTTGIPTVTGSVIEPVPITHVRFTSVAAPQFRECRELSSSGDARRFLACDGAEVSFVPEPNSPTLVIDIPEGGIVLVRRIEDGKRVRFQLDVPHPAPHFDREFTDDPPDAPSSAIPARSTPARKGIS